MYVKVRKCWNLVKIWHFLSFHSKIEEKLKALSKFGAQFLEEHSILGRMVPFWCILSDSCGVQIESQKNGYPAIFMPISVQGRENHSNKWRYRTKFWATGRLNSKFMLVTRGHKGSTWPQLTPCWPYGVNIRYQVNGMWYGPGYVFRLIFRSETESELHFALQNFPTYFFSYYMTRLGESSFEEILSHGTFSFVYCTIVTTKPF